MMAFCHYLTESVDIAFGIILEIAIIDGAQKCHGLSWPGFAICLPKRRIS